MDSCFKLAAGVVLTSLAGVLGGCLPSLPFLSLASCFFPVGGFFPSPVRRQNYTILLFRCFTNKL